MAESSHPANTDNPLPVRPDTSHNPRSKDWLDLNRREFLAALAAAYGTTACAYAAPRSWHIDYAGGEAPRKIERFANTLCTMCPGGCGLNMRVVHGCAVGVRGNATHPINRGGLCSRASVVLQDLYNPDRLHTPLKRVGGRDSDQWEPVDWDTALKMLSEPLRAMRAGGNPEGLAVILGRDRGLIRTAWRRFVHAYGSPNLIEATPDDNLGVSPAVLATHGIRQRLGYDIAKAAFVLSFSSEWLDAHWSAEQAARGFAEFRRGRPGYRPKWVHLGPRFSLTAAKADEWVPIKPGTEGILALGIAHVIIREGLYDRAFVERHGYGFEDEKPSGNGGEDGLLGFRRIVLQEYTPEKVQAATGAPEGTLFRLGRAFGTQRPAIALGYDGGGCGTQSAYDRMAIHCLNALVGSIDVPGGVTVFQELSLLNEDVGLDAIAERGLAQPRLDGGDAQHRLSDNAVDLLSESLLQGRPYPAKALFLVDANPVFSSAKGAHLAEALASVPFIAAFSAYHNDSTRHADLILPPIHSLHRWDFNVAHTLRGHPVVTISHPVLPPRPEMRDPYEIVRDLSKRLGSPIAEALPWADGKAAVDAVCRALFKAGKGAAFGPANEESWAQLLERRGWRAPFAKDYDAFKRDVLAGGGWTDPIYFHHEWDRVFRNPKRRFAFRSAYLEGTFASIPDSNGLGDATRRCLPDCQIEPRKPSADYPLDLYVYALPNLVGVSSPNLPWLNDIAGAYMFEKWRTWVELHPETAHANDLHDGDWVEVRTTRGRLRLPVKIYAGLLPETIAIPFGFGHQSGGRWCKGIGENPSVLVDSRTDPLTGTALWNKTRASIKKA